MTGIEQSTRDFETWLRGVLGDQTVEADLQKKHRKMAEAPFKFLRATYWRWAEQAGDLFGSLLDNPKVLAVGDIHVENFGVWRDHEGRMVWGVNDFDDAAVMPYSLDLVRLVTSAALATEGGDLSVGEISEAILEGYTRGLEEPKAFVLERDHQWLREWIEETDPKREKFWRKIDRLETETPPERFGQLLATALPEATYSIRMARRSSGTGSLGRPRWVAIGELNGGPVVREAKALAMSAWNRAHAPDDNSVQADILLNGPHRAPDPGLRIEANMVVRRLAPHDRKIEIDDDSDINPTIVLLEAMGHEIANLHTADLATGVTIRDHLPTQENDWLKDAASDAVEAVVEDFEAFNASQL